MISGKEAAVAWIDNVPVEVRHKGTMWMTLSFPKYGVDVFKSKNHEFRLKPRTVNLNGVECGLLVSSQWSQGEPNKVKLEFKNSDDAHYFRSKALQIFNDKQG